MSYNILNKNVKFQGATQGTIENVVDTHSDKTVSGQKTITDLSSSTAHVATRLQVGGVHAADHAVAVAGAISGSGNISGSVANANNALTASFVTASNVSGRVANATNALTASLALLVKDANSITFTVNNASQADNANKLGT